MTAPEAPYGDVLRRRRVACGMTQQDLADRAGVAKSSLRSAEASVHKDPRSRALIEAALAAAESGASVLAPSGGLRFTATDGATHFVDADDWSPSSLSARDRVLCQALLSYALSRFKDDTPTTS